MRLAVFVELFPYKSVRSFLSDRKRYQILSRYVRETRNYLSRGRGVSRGWFGGWAEILLEDLEITCF